MCLCICIFALQITNKLCPSSDQSSSPPFIKTQTNYSATFLLSSPSPPAMQNNAPSGFQGFHFPLQQSDLYTFAPASQNQQQQQQQLYYAAQAAHGQQPSTDSSESAGPSQKKKPAGARKHGVKEEPEEHGKADEPKKKRSKRSAGKACVYCRRRWVDVSVWHGLDADWLAAIWCAKAAGLVRDGEQRVCSVDGG